MCSTCSIRCLIAVSSAHALMTTMRQTLLKYEPRLAALDIDLLPQVMPGHLEYAVDVQLKSGQKVMFGTSLSPEGKVLVRHLKQQNYLPKPGNR